MAITYEGEVTSLILNVVVILNSKFKDYIFFWTMIMNSYHVTNFPNSLQIDQSMVKIIGCSINAFLKNQYGYRFCSAVLWNM